MRKVVLALAMILAAGPAGAFEISSPAVGTDGVIPDKHVANSFGCSGGNVSLPLTWSGVPEGAKSLALTIYDPDAPTGSGFWHWLVVNMPPSTNGLPEGAGDANGTGLPQGAVQARNDAGTSAYFGPCPPAGDPPHHYVVTLFAVSADTLPLDANASGAVVGFTLHFNTLDKTSVTYTYGR
jgi:Raf kinase inhibitor-like YbhB/YbcL family protein